jgi:V/A-type H+-transporting ATPase subunit E
MALDNVMKDIVDSAKGEADQSLRNAEAEKAVILQQAQATISEMKRKEEKQLEDAIGRLKRQEISSAELESKKIVLSKQKEILDRAFEATLDDLCNMSALEKKRVFRMMIRSTQDVIKDPKVFCPVGEKGHLDGTPGIASVNEDPNLKGGLLLESQDGSVQIDFGFRTILESVWERELKSLSDILFG